FSNYFASTQLREFDSTLSICPWPNNKSALLICSKQELSLLAVHLEVNGYTVMHESNLADGLDVALEETPDLVMVKIANPEIDGADFCRAMHDDQRGRSCYIVLIVE